MDKNVTKALNEQIVKEFYSAYLYLQMAAWCEERNLKGFSNWMRVQAQEESCHALIFFNYILERGETVAMGAVDKPLQEFKSPLHIFEEVLKHEKFVTDSINNIMDTAITAKDHASKARLDWFITEQVEEEANASEILGKLKILGESCGGDGLLQLDRELAARTFVMPAPLATAAN